ncbi:uncharacterized protein LOC125943421 [Dermacentor silvarum]|uniref:uncharacterized protein LOC125943421 n=1 Tax=Dermacentor silvarum TaxID=543639 RepID=UPI0021013064|nr:uncharacterized protein LOC125943421 [Dermacentor silvarum]
MANTTESYECITKHPLFELYCLNRRILDLEYLKLKHYCTYHLGQRTSNEHNKMNSACHIIERHAVHYSIYFIIFFIYFIYFCSQYRYTAYRQFVWWAYRRLGQVNRVVLPSCPAHRIRKEFPTSGRHYTGYLDA